MIDISQKVITIIFPAEEGIFFSSRTATPAMRPTLPHLEWEARFYQEAERLVCEATHFIQCQVKNEQLHSSVHSYSMPLCFYRDQFTLFLPTFNNSSAITFVAVHFIRNK